MIIFSNKWKKQDEHTGIEIINNQVTDCVDGTIAAVHAASV